MAVLQFSPTVGDRINLALRRSGISQQELARRIGKSNATVSRYVADEIVPPLPILQRIAEALPTYRTLLMDLSDLPTIEDKDNDPDPGNVTDLGERRSTCIPVSAGQKAFLLAS